MFFDWWLALFALSDSHILSENLKLKNEKQFVCLIF